MISNTVSEFRTEYNLLSNTLTDKEAELAVIHNSIRDRLKLISDNEVALSILKKMLDISNNDTINVFSKFITTGLRSIFNKDYSIEFVVKDRGNKNKVVEIMFKDGENEAIPIDDAIGGGVQVIIGFLLQVIILKVFNKRMFILLDESLVQVSKQYLPATMKFIKEMSREHGLVTLVITHVDLSDYADVSYEMVNGELKEIYRSVDIVPEDPCIELVVKDFQIIKLAKMRANGLTIITGPTNNGKSALFRSIIYTLKNQQGSHFINKDAEVCKTAIAFTNFIGHKDVTVQYIKGKTSKLTIEYDGQTTSLEKLGRGDDAAIKLYQPYNLDGVKLGEMYLTPNWWRQMEVPLTTQLDGKGDLFKLFNSMSGTEDLMKAIYKISEDIKVLANERKELNVKSDVYSIEVGNIKTKVEKMNNILVKIDELFSDYSKSQSAIETMEYYKSEMIKSKDAMDQSKLYDKLIKKSKVLIETCKNVSVLKNHIGIIDKCKSIETDIHNKVVLIDKTNKLITISKNVLSLKSYNDELIKTKKKQKYVDAFVNLIPSLNGILKTNENILNMKNYLKYNTINKTVNKNLKVSDKIVNVLHNLLRRNEVIIALKQYKTSKINTVKLGKMLSLEPHFDSLRKHMINISQLKGHMELLNKNEILQTEFETIQNNLATIKVCPTCKQPAHF